MIEMLDTLDENIGLIYRYKAVLSRVGGTRIYDFVQGRLSTLQNVSVPSTSTSGWNISSRPGGYAHIAFDGIDDKIVVAGLLDNNKAVTVMAWISLIGIDTQGAEAISIGDVIGLTVDLVPGPLLQGFYHYGSDLWQITNFSTALVGTGWQHIAYVVDPGRSRQALYLNGSLKASSTFTDAIDYTGLGPDTIFASHGNGNPNRDFKGYMDDIRIYKRGLSTTEIYKIAIESYLRSDIETIGLSEGYYLPSIRPVQDYVR